MNPAQQGCCTHCGALVPLTLPALVNTARDSGLKAKVRDGSLFVWTCPYCGTRNLVAAPLLYHDPQSRLMVWLLPPYEGAEEQIRRAESQLTELEGYTLRCVADAGSLIEKVHIYEAGLDDVVMELCKWVTKRELSESEKDPSVLDRPFKFFRLDGADNTLLFSYPKDGQMLLAQTGFRSYEDCRGIVSRHPGMQPPRGRFARIDPAWIERIVG